MERLDIPFFEHLIDGEELPLPEGLAPIPGFMKASGLSAAQRRLQELDQGEITFQQQLIRGAIAARHLKASAGSGVGAASTRAASVESVNPRSEPGVISSDLHRHEAFRLGEELWSAAIRDRKGRPEWLGMDLGADGESFHFGLIGNSLYSGASGIAVLFARLAMASTDPAAAAEWRQRAWSCFKALAELAERNSNDQLFRLVRDLPYGIGGSGGTLLALQLLDQAGIDGAATLANLLVQQLRPERLQADEGLDVIGGVAGLIGPLLHQNTPQTLELAVAAADRLLSLQLASGGWPSSGAPASQRRPALTGFSHGAAGMAAALAQLAHATGEARFAEGAHRAIAYERGVFVSDQGNWPDFRSSSEPTDFMLSWCHGAPGILLSRLVLQAARLADGQTGSEQQVARASTLAAIEHFTGAGHAEQPAHLCCGALGLTSLVRLDAEISCTPLDPRVTAAEASIISQARSSGSYTFFSVDGGSLSLPGLLTGKAGVALALLEASEGQSWLPRLLSAGLLVTG
jgi:lantibiotic modifying enzyme